MMKYHWKRLDWIRVRKVSLIFENRLDISCLPICAPSLFTSFSTLLCNKCISILAVSSPASSLFIALGIERFPLFVFGSDILKLILSEGISDVSFADSVVDTHVVVHHVFAVDDGLIVTGLEW